MGYRKLSTSDIQDLMRRWRAREGVRQIARETGIDRKTVRRYIAAAKSFEIDRDRELDPTQEEIASITHRVQARPPRSPSEAWQQLMPYKDKIAACVDEQQRLRLRAARAMLASEGIQVTYWTLRRFAIRARMELSSGAATHANGAASHTNGVASHTNGAAAHTNGVAAHTNGAAAHTNGAAAYTNGVHTNGVHTNGAHTNGAHTNGAHTNGAATYTNGVHTNGVHTNGAATYTNGVHARNGARDSHVEARQTGARAEEATPAPRHEP